MAIDRLNRGVLAATYVCIHYQCDLPGAVNNTDDEMHISVYATLGMIAGAVGAEVANLDTKWRTRSDGGCVQAVLAGRRRTAPKPGERGIPELLVGGHLYDMGVVAIAHANKDNYFSARTLMAAPARMMPCSRPGCLHAVCLARGDCHSNDSKITF